MRHPFRLLVVCPLVLLLLLGAGSSLIGAQDIEQQVPVDEVHQSDDSNDQDVVVPMPDGLPIQDLSSTLDELDPPTGDDTSLQIDPTVVPEEIPTVEPPFIPEEIATFIPEEIATFIPEEIPTLIPEEMPTLDPTIEPTIVPTLEPTLEPPVEPTLVPTLEPPVEPTVEPTLVPPIQPTLVPPIQPTLVPTIEPTSIPPLAPTPIPPVAPTRVPPLAPTPVPPVVPEDLDGSGIRYEVLPGTTEGGGGQHLQPYLFTFDLYASIPGHLYSEPMIVSVRSGSFAFTAGDENLVVIDAAGAPIPLLTTLDDPPFFQESRRVQLVLVDDSGQPCTTLCAVPAGRTVLVQPGNTVFLPGGTTCFWCSIDTTGAELEVYAALPSGAEPTQFSWTQLEGIGTAWIGPGAVRASILPGFAYGCRGHIGG